MLGHASKRIPVAVNTCSRALVHFSLEENRLRIRCATVRETNRGKICLSSPRRYFYSVILRSILFLLEISFGTANVARFLA